MTNTRTTFAILFALALYTTTATTATTQAADTCPNGALRTGPSANLPDCRAYELVSPDSNHASLGSQAGGVAAGDGNTMVYKTIDSPEHTDFGSVNNFVRARRDPVTGWSGAAIAMPVSEPTAGFFANVAQSVSSDLESVLITSDQGPTPTPPGMHIWVTNVDGTTRRVTSVGNPFYEGLDLYRSFDSITAYYSFRDVFFKPAFAQLPADPAPGASTYHWANGQLRLLGILPDGAPAPFGANLAPTVVLPPVSEDGGYVLFDTVGDPTQYLRIDDPEIDGDEETIEFAKSQRTVDPDPNPHAVSSVGGVTRDGSKVLFTSRSELTNDAYTGRTGGVSTDAGNDLYSYDIASGDLTDLTVDTNPADAATGANVQALAGATPDGETIYFTAKGHLADGARSGHVSLYVLRDGFIDFVSDADDVTSRAVVSEDGQAIAFTSTASLTGYDNTDPVTGQPHQQVFIGRPGHPLECVSCRPDGSAPTSDSAIGGGRAVSNGGKHVFFETADAVLPQASSGLTQVYQYSQGEISPISRINGTTRAYYLDASASGEDVFFATHDDLVPNPNAGDFAVFDARVGGGFAQSVKDDCNGSACQGAATPPPSLPVAATVTFTDKVPDGSLRAVGKVSVSKSLSVKGMRAAVKVKVPDRGRLTVSGSRLKAASRKASRARTVTLTLSLTRKAQQALKQRKTLRTMARVTFTNADGDVSTATVSLTFRSASTRKGR